MSERAENRRFDKSIKKERQYERSGFIDRAVYGGPMFASRSKYAPHIGKKEIGRYA